MTPEKVIVFLVVRKEEINMKKALGSVNSRSSPEGELGTAIK